jgi:3-hydroxyisobutyrate dehydrogenase
MGSRMAVALLRGGHAVTVWNRTSARALPLVEQGASLASSPRAAADDAQVVLAMVRDDEASRQVWLSKDGALAAMSAEAIGIESSTLSAKWVRELATSFAAHGVGFLDAPVVGTRAQADTASLIHLIGGDVAIVARATPVLSAIGGVAHHVGPAGSGAVMKLVVNAFLGIQVAALGELLGAAAQMGLDRRRAGEVLIEMPSCSASAKGVTLAMLARNFAPAFPVELVEKDLGYLADETKPGSAPLNSAARAVFVQAIAAGLAADNMTAVAKLYE